jgi:uncharacterized membrane protein
MRISRLTCALFAVATGCLGILSFVYPDSSPLWQSISTAIPARAGLVYGSAFVLVVAGAGLCFARTALPSILAIILYCALWAVADAPPIFHDLFSFGSWYGVNEAATSLAGAWILYAALQSQSRAPGTINIIGGERGLRAARVIFGLTCIFYGASHFAFAEFTARFVPTWLPNRLGLAYFTGACHIAAGVGVILGILPRLAAMLEAIMMSLFGLLVWVPSFFARPRPEWAGTTQNQWSEIIANLVLAAAACVIADSLRTRPSPEVVSEIVV